MVEATRHTFANDTLYIRVSMSDLIFAVYDSRQKDSLRWERIAVKSNVSLTTNLREAIRNSSITQEKYRRVRTLVQSTTTIMPINNFNEDEIEDVYHFNFPELERINVFYDTLPHLNAALLFSLDKDACRVLEEEYQGVYFTSSITPVLTHFADPTRNDGSYRIFAYLNKGWLDVFAFKEGKLILSNSFITKSVEDTVYYLLFAAKIMKINQLEDEMFLVGITENKQKLLEQLREYVPNTFFINPAAQFTRHPVALCNEIPYDLMTFIIQNN